MEWFWIIIVVFGLTVGIIDDYPHIFVIIFLGLVYFLSTILPILMLINMIFG